jgi:hypothetical protein
MIAGIFHLGSGLGNQLHRYVAAHVLAEDKGYQFTMIAKDNFKGKDFMKLDLFNTGIPYTGKYLTEYPSGKVVVPELPLWEEDTDYYNPEFNFIEDNTVIDGEFQSEQYFGHRLQKIDGWLGVEPLDVPDDVCVIGFRGGEFYVYPELGLPQSYFDEGIKMMKKINPDMRFEVHTDDPVLAKKFFPDYMITHDIGINWRSMRYARYAIIANSSFYILPRLLADYDVIGSKTIAPRYWARRNTKEWSRPDNFYKSFKYI